MNWSQIWFGLGLAASGYTDNAVKALIAARQNAIHHNLNVISTGHVMLGVASVEGSAAQLALRCLGLDLSQQVAEISALASNNMEKATWKRFGFSQQSKQLLNRAQTLAIQWGQKHVGTEHLLAGLLEGPPSVWLNYLHDQGISLSRFQQELQKLYKEYKTPKSKKS